MPEKRTLRRCLPVMASSFVQARLPRQRAGECDLRAVIAADLHTDADPYRDRTDVLRRAFAGTEGQTCWSCAAIPPTAGTKRNTRCWGG